MNLNQSLPNEPTRPIDGGMRWETPISELADGVGRLLVRRGHYTLRMTILGNPPFTHIIESECSEDELWAAIEEYTAALLVALDAESQAGFLTPAGVHTDENGDASFFYNPAEYGTPEHKIVSGWIKQAHAKLQAAS